jgi:predicted enzyme related to lactoylglutathione lyase
VAHEIAHQHVYDVFVDCYLLKHYSCRHYSIRKEIDRFDRHGYARFAMIKSIKFVSIPVTDQDRALTFYTEKLGFRIMTDKPFDDKQRWIELSIPGGETGVVLFTPKGHEDRIGTQSAATFNCDDVQKTYATLIARGVEFDAPPAKQPWGQYAIFRDVDRNQFVLSSK